jgi:O-antigen ligase
MTFISTCIFTVLYFLRPFEIFSSMKSIPMLLVVGVFAIISLFFDVTSGKIKLFSNGTDQMMLGFYVAIGLSHLSHLYFGGAIQSIQQFFPAFVGYLLVAHSIDSVKKLKIFLLILIFIVAIIACEGILEAKNGISYFGVKPLQQGVGFNDEGEYLSISRIIWVGPFSDPNDLAMVFVAVVPFLLDYMLKRVFFVPGSLLALVLYGLYLTNSRGGLLALLATVFTYIVLRYKSMKGIVVGLFLGFVLVCLGSSRMLNISSSEGSAYGRLDAWYSGYQMFKSAPLMGVGQGRFIDYNALTAHNSFVLVFAELGILGAFFFTGIFYYPMIYGYYASFKNTEPSINESLNGISNAAVSSLVGAMVSMFFLSRSYVFLPYLLVALSISTFSLTSNSDMFEKIKNKSNNIIIFIGTVSGIIFVNIVIKLLL